MELLSSSPGVMPYFRSMSCAFCFKALSDQEAECPFSLTDNGCIIRLSINSVTRLATICCCCSLLARESGSKPHSLAKRRTP